MNRPYHFYLVFNPLFNKKGVHQTQAHEFYYALKNQIQSGDSLNSHFYWGKLEMSETNLPLQFNKFKEAIDRNRNQGHDTHLYISDFNHLWVAKIASVHQNIVDPSNTLPFYEGKKVEIWFKCIDMDLISNNYVETLYYLEHLYVDSEFSGQKIESINPYLGNLRYPLIVQDSLEEKYFRKEDGIQFPRILQENPLIVEPGLAEKLTHTLQSYVLPPFIFSRLSEQVRKEILNCEILMNELKKKPEEKEIRLQQVASGYLKILEVVLNQTVMDHLSRECGESILVKDNTPPILVHGKMVDEKDCIPLSRYSGNFSLGIIYSLLEKSNYFSHIDLSKIFESKMDFWDYCRIELRDVIKRNEWVMLRNMLSGPHKDFKLRESMALEVRNQILGVGHVGILNSLIQTYFFKAEKKYRKAG